MRAKKIMPQSFTTLCSQTVTLTMKCVLQSEQEKEGGLELLMERVCGKQSLPSVKVNALVLFKVLIAG